MNKIIKYWQYLLLVPLCLTPLVWFLGKGNVIINGIDTNFPLSPVTWFLRRLYVWSSVSSGGADFSSSTAGLFFHLIQVIPSLVGFNLHWVQLISFLFWFSLIVFGAFILSRIIFPNRFLIQLLFVNLYVFNIYLFNTWENVKVANLSLISAIPLGLSALLLLRNKKITYNKFILFASFIGLIVSGAGINPAYIISFLLTLLIFTVADILVDFSLNKAFEKVKNFLMLFLFVILVNVHWILSTLGFIFQNITSSGSIDKLGFTNWVQSLSENTSLLNIMRLQGAWDWYAFDVTTGLPLFIPYALRYLYDPFFILFSFSITGLAISAFFYIRKSQNYLYLAFGMMFITGVFMGGGTHLPTGYLFHWMSRHIPFFSLFRSPWYIFTPLLVLSLAGLVALLFNNISAYLEKIHKLNRYVISVTIILLILGNTIYSYPLLQGKIFRPGQNQSFYVNFPNHVFEAQNWLSANKEGRIIGYPDDEIERFNWGYVGIDSILNLLVDNETLFTPLNSPDAPIAKLVKRYYLNLKRGEIDSANSLAAKLNIKYIFEKKDQSSLSASLPDYITNLQNKTIGLWTFYQYPEEKYLPKIFSASNLYLSYSQASQEQNLSVLPIRDVTINYQDSAVKRIENIQDINGEIVLSSNSQLEEASKFINSSSVLSNRLMTRDLSTVEFNFQIPESGKYQPILEKYSLEEFEIDYKKGLDVLLDGHPIKLEYEGENDSFIYFKETDFQKGNYRLILALRNQNLVTGGNMNDIAGLIQEGNGKFELFREGENRYLSILNKSSKDAAAVFPVQKFDPFMAYMVQVKYHQIYGNNAQIMLGQGNNNTAVKTQVERIPNYPEWTSVSFYYEPVKTKSSMEVSLIAPYTKDPLGTKISYDDLEIYKVFQNSLFFVKKSKNELTEPNIIFKKDSHVSYSGSIEGASGPHTIIFSENYSPNWEFSIEGANKLVGPIHFSANNYANAWFIQGVPSDYKFNIYYKPQRLWLLGAVISLLTFMSAVIFYILRSGLIGKK